MVLSGSRSISYTYRTSGGLHDDEASRVSTVVEDTGSGVTIAQYEYLGVGTLVRTRLNAIACFSRVYDGTNAIVDLDRFNRITTNRWTKDLATDRDLYQTVITYDRNSNITSIEDNVHTGLDVKYTMDSVNRRKLGAGDGVRTRDIQLGKLTLYQLSYARNCAEF